MSRFVSKKSRRFCVHRVEGYFPSFDQAARWLDTHGERVEADPSLLADAPPEHIDIGTLRERTGLRFLVPADAPVDCVIAFDDRLRIFDVRTAPRVRMTHHANERAEERLSAHFNDSGRASRWLAAQVDLHVREGKTRRKRPGWVITKRPARPEDIWVLVKLKSERVAILLVPGETNMLAITCMTRSDSGSPKKRLRHNAKQQSKQVKGAAARGKSQRKARSLHWREDDAIS